MPGDWREKHKFEESWLRSRVAYRRIETALIGWHCSAFQGRRARLATASQHPDTDAFLSFAAQKTGLEKCRKLESLSSLLGFDPVVDSHMGVGHNQGDERDIGPMYICRAINRYSRESHGVP
jgi:hypothetical protein